MFLRIYGTIALAILVALAISVSIYKVSYNERLTAYSEGILLGSMKVISKGYQRQSDSKKHRWLKLIAQITGLNISVKQESGDKKTWKIKVEAESLEAEFVENNNHFFLSLDQLSEQQLRGIALLIINELALVSNAEKNQLVNSLSTHFPFPLSLVESNSETFKLDNQQRQLFESGNVVVFSKEPSSQTVIAKIGGVQVLIVGPIKKFVPLTMSLFLILLLVNLLITSLTTYWVIRKLELRMNRINKAVSAFGPANIDVKVPVEGKDVIASLSQKVNEMTGRIQELLTHQKEITQAVSHELRTPIARIKFRLELLSDELAELGIEQSAPISNKIQGVENDLGGLESLVGEILTLHKLDTVELHNQGTIFELQPMIAEKIERFALNHSEIEFDFISIEDSSIFAKERDVSRLLDNIIGNACKHAKSKVSIALQDELVSTRIIIEDNGLGISRENRKKIFQPFTQIKDSKNQHVSGYGLGLAIVRKIAQLNHLEVCVEESILGGARFDIVCPKPSEYDKFQQVFDDFQNPDEDLEVIKSPKEVV